MLENTTFTAIDFESAGTASGKTDAPIQIGTTTWSINDGISDTWVSYIATDKPITWAAQKVHGISKDDLKNAPKFMQLWPDIKKRLADKAVVAHGHGTEKRFLKAFPGHQFGPWIDTLQLSRAAFPELASHSLGSVCEELQLTEQIKAIVEGKHWHDALFDAVASVILLKHIIKTFQLEQAPLSSLMKPNTSIWRSHRTGK